MEKFLEMKGISKIFPGVVANDKVDFWVKKGEIHALLGENGAGKSTLMRILYGLYEPDAGEIFIDGQKADIRSPHDAIRLGVGMVHQEFMLVNRFTVAENVALGLEISPGPLLDIKPVEEKINYISSQHGLALEPTVRIEHLSIGIQQRVEIVKLLCRDAKLLILDEPTAVLTPQEVESFFEILRSLVCDGCAIVLITHKLKEVMTVCDRVTVLRHGKVEGVKNVKDTNPTELAGMMVGRDVLFNLHKKTNITGKPVIQVENLHANNERDLPALRGISLEVRAGEILGIAGVDGNGQPELAETLAGMRGAKGGKIFFEGEEVSRLTTASRYARGMAYIPADRRNVGTIHSLDIAWNSILSHPDDFTTTHGAVLSSRRISDHAQKIVSQFDVRTPGINLRAEKLSGGNLQKLLLGRELLRRPKLIIIEQPTRGLDIGATEYIRNQILESRENGAAILLISAELDEILDLSDRIAVIYDGEIMGILNSAEADRQSIGLMMAGSHKQSIEQSPEKI